MTTWEYRVTKRGAQGAETYEIRGVHYNAVGEILMWSTDANEPSGDDLEELAADLNHMTRALSKPVLDLDEMQRRETP